MFAYIVVFLLVTYIIFSPIYSAYLFTHPPKIKISFRTPKDWGVEYEELALPTADGLVLDGWYVPSRNGGAVMLWHGHSANRLGVAFHAETLIQAGFGVLMLDLRAHGSSDGRLFAPRSAIQDILAGVAFLSKRADVKAGRIGLFGVGMGGTLGLHAASQTVAIRALGIDSPVGTQPEDVRDTPSATLWGRFRLWRWRYYQRLVVRFSRQEPLPATLHKLPDRPTLLLATGKETPALIARRWIQAGGDAYYGYLLPDAKQVQGWRVDADAYAHRLVRFFEQTLLAEENQMLGELFPRDRVQEKEATIPAGLVNMASLGLVPLVLGITLWVYANLWGDFSPMLETLLKPSAFFGVLAIFIVSVLVHELLHAVGFVYVGKADWSTVTFGFNWRGMAPYAHCFEPMPVQSYRWAVALPGLVLGGVPVILGWLTGWFWLVLFGAVMLITAAGDWMILWAVRRVLYGTIVRDHSDKVGCEIL